MKSTRQSDLTRLLARLGKRSPVAAIVVIVLILIAVKFWSSNKSEEDRTLVPGPAIVKRVVDGDTIILIQETKDGTSHKRVEERVRLIGVDTPETVHPSKPVQPWGPEASEFTKQFLAGGTVKIALGATYRDKYERVLAFVYADDRMLNVALARAGLARVKIYPGESCPETDLIVRAGEEAKAEEIGIWSGRKP